MKNKESSKNYIRIILSIVVGVILVIGIIVFICTNYVSKEFIYEQTKECRDTYAGIETSYLSKSDTLQEIFYSPKLNECVLAYVFNNPSKNKNGKRYTHTGYYIEGLSSNTSFEYELVGSWHEYSTNDGGYWNEEYRYNKNDENIFNEAIYRTEKKAKIKKDRLKKIEKLKRRY